MKTNKFTNILNLYTIQYKFTNIKFKIYITDNLGYSYKLTLNNKQILEIEEIFTTKIDLLFDKCFIYNHIYKYSVNINYIDKILDLEILDIIENKKYVFNLNEIKDNVDRIIRLEKKMDKLKLRLKNMENLLSTCCIVK